MDREATSTKVTGAGVIRQLGRIPNRGPRAASSERSLGGVLAPYHGIHLRADRHGERPLAGQLHHHGACLDALGHHVHRGHDLGGGLALCQPLAHLPVARERAHARGHEIPQPRQAGEGVRPATEGDAEARQLGEATRDDRGAGVHADAEALAMPARWR